MPARIVKQPNGLYARFSTVVDQFTDWGMTYDDAWELMRFDGGIPEANYKMGTADASPERFEEALRTIERIHGKEEADCTRAMLAGESATAETL